ncbi:MAG TPA: hypothetical protein VFE33_15630 [Thermoanaerobaculia bacterium]|nr:hypothetical protein [Thermoanaerobaculia bacterium]
MAEHPTCPFAAFRPAAEDLAALAAEVAEIPELQRLLVERDDHLKLPDRVAHQYQIAGGKVVLEIAPELPAELAGIGLFEAGARHEGVGRLSTCLGTPHAETDPDFLGLMAAFATARGRRVDFLALNEPAFPANDHREFMDVLHATGESAGAPNLVVQQAKFAAALASRRGALQGAKTLAHVLGQSARTSHSTAFQSYWTGIEEIGGSGARFNLVPVRDEKRHAGPAAGKHPVSEEWAQLQAAGDVVFELFWIPFLSEQETPTERLTEAWREDHKKKVGRLIFPRTDLTSPESRLWAALASEMGANPGNWVHDRDDTIGEPATRFGAARKIAYGLSQKGRDALAPELYRTVFTTGRIDSALAAELARRREEKERVGQESWASG